MDQTNNSISESFPNITLLRAIAVLMVVYDHLFGILPLRFFSSTTLIVPYVQNVISTPLGIIQDFGWMGVALFFIISGFIISHVGMRETRTEFIIKRFFRIYPPLTLAIFITCAATYYSYGQTYTPKDILTAFTLTNYWMYPQVAILGVGWTLAVEILFYVFTFTLLPLLKKYPSIAIIIQLAIIIVIYAICTRLGNGFFLFSTCIAYLPYLIAGQVTYFLYSKMISVKIFFSLFLSIYAVTLVGLKLIHTEFLPASNSYLINFTYAYFIFVIFLIFKDKLKLPTFVQFLADTSYSIYLLHGAIGGSIIVLISRSTESRSPMIIFITSIVATVVSIFSAWVFFKLVEMPSIAVARSACRMIKAKTTKA